MAHSSKSQQDKDALNQLADRWFRCADNAETGQQVQQTMEERLETWRRTGAIKGKKQTG
jgi:hypothetical protein